MIVAAWYTRNGWAVSSRTAVGAVPGVWLRPGGRPTARFRRSTR